MCEAILLTYRMVRINKWKIGQANYYLRIKCINTTLAGNCVRYGSNAAKQQTALGNIHGNKRYDEELVKLHDEKIDQFQEPRLPQFWNILDTIDTGVFLTHKCIYYALVE